MHFVPFRSFLFVCRVAPLSPADGSKPAVMVLRQNDTEAEEFQYRQHEDSHLHVDVRFTMNSHP
jgi:hypothetical protein